MKATIAGRVVRGQGYGRKLGFPTANIDRRQWYKHRQLKLGVYAGLVELSNNRVYKAGIVVGPLDNRKLPRLEAYLLGFKGNLYGQKVTFHIQKYLRPFKQFASEAVLKKQIAQDIKDIKQIKFHE